MNTTRQDNIQTFRTLAAVLRVFGFPRLHEYFNFPLSYRATVSSCNTHGMGLTSEIKIIYGEGRKEMFYLTMHSTHYMVKNHSDSER